MTTNAKSEATESIEELEDEKSFFIRGAMVGLLGGVVVAVLIMSVAGSVLSLIDDVFGSATVAAADSTEPSIGEASLVAAGEELATNNGCVACHSRDGIDGIGPTWSGLAERVDEAYIRQSILEPNAAIAAGFPENLMPAFYADRLSDDDLNALVAYISSL